MRLRHLRYRFCFHLCTTLSLSVWTALHIFSPLSVTADCTGWYLATSKHIRKLYKRKHDSVTDYLHKVTRYLAEYCREQGITCVVAGDIRNIRREKDLGHRTNQKFHSLPYNRIYIMLEYKLKRYGIRFIKQPANKKSRLN